MELAAWKNLVQELEFKTFSLKGERIQAQELKRRVEKALSQAEPGSGNQEIVNRLDHLLIVLTVAAKENICANTKCPYYNKKCKMR